MGGPRAAKRGGESCAPQLSDDGPVGAILLLLWPPLRTSAYCSLVELPVAKLWKSFPNAGKATFDNLKRVDICGLNRPISAGRLDSLPRTPIAPIEDRHGSCELCGRGDRNDDPLRVLRVADIHDHCSPQRGVRVAATL
jgi:hypothetical protein